MITGSGFVEKDSYELRGEEFTFVLNDFVELRNRLGPDKQSAEFKAVLRMTKVFKVHAQTSLQQSAPQRQEVRLLEKLFDVSADEQTENQLSGFEVINVELRGYCSDSDQLVFTKMFSEFATKFIPFVELKPLKLSSICEPELS